MNDLCVQIQNEKNYQQFEELAREVTALVSAKRRRFPESTFAPAGAGQKVLPAAATRTLPSVYKDHVEMVEIHIAGTEYLYGEIRVENSFTDEHGNTLAIQPPAPIEVKLEAPAHNLSMKSPGQPAP